jgi:uncharacterized membrane protein
MKTIELQISDEAAESMLQQIGGPATAGDDPLVGGRWFIRTVTFHLVGNVVRRAGSFLVLKDASWVADSGRFMQAIKDGSLSEVEPVGEAVVSIASIVDAFPWKHALPTDQK